jgi:hypothetical protein
MTERLAASIEEVATMTSQSRWSVEEKLRLGHYRAKKSGRRTLVVIDSVKQDFDALPDATFNPSRRALHK